MSFSGVRITRLPLVCGTSAEDSGTGRCISARGAGNGDSFIRSSRGRSPLRERRAQLRSYSTQSSGRRRRSAGVDQLVGRISELILVIFVIVLIRPYIPKIFSWIGDEISSVCEDLGLPIGWQSYVLVGIGLLFMIGSLIRLVRHRQNQGEARYRLSQKRRVRRSPRKQAGDVPLHGRKKRRKDPDPPLRF